MIRLLFGFLLLLASVWLGIQLSHDPGYLLITINHWSVETTLWVAIIALFLFFIIFHVLLLLLSKLTHAPATFRSWQLRRRALKAQAKTRQGLIEFSEGYWSQAKNHLIKALPDTDSPLLNYLTAARAAQEMGDSQLRDNYLREAQQSMPEAKIAVELTQAQLQLANQQWEQALATLRHLQDLAPHHPFVLKLLMQLYQEVKDWPQLITLLPELKKNKVIPSKVFEQLQHQTYLLALTDLIKQEQLIAVKKIITSLPKTLTCDPDLMFEYCRFLIKSNEQILAESVLRACLRKEYNEKLISLYGQIKSSEKQLDFAESLLKKYSHSAALYLCLGRLSLHQQLWGKARNYFEKSIHLSAMPETYEELGSLLEYLNDQTNACCAYRKGLALATGQI